ncbi:MAG: SDR family oxidoreductase [Clostridiales Family XIII bacterium]|jgi:3-oxoacyl-[acyl-carrier protein] reductase|nr:SDR family oxidoreductase [Clostridiales Family XIII bacterium]
MQYKEYDLEGRVAVITGAASGVGREAAIQLAKCGAKVVVIARTQPKIDAVVSEIEAGCGEALGIALDVADELATNAAADSAITKFGRIDILVNNAGIEADREPGQMGADILTTTSIEQYRRVLDVNLIGHYNMIRACLPAMLSREYGRVVNISSVTGLNGGVGSAAYVASKAGIFVQTKTFASNYAARNILFNSIAPGMVDTPMHATTPPEAFEWAKEATPMKRIAQPIDIVRVILFLAQNHLFMTGEMLVVDGGGNMI